MVKNRIGDDMKTILKGLKIFLAINILLFITVIIAFVIINHNLKYEMPQIINIELYDQDDTKYLSYCNGRKQSYVTLDNISPFLIDAFIAIEDKRFYEHRGVDFIRIMGAIIADIRQGEFAEGASTITQQYVRTLFLNNDKTIKRKINEVLIAMNLESKYSKDEILEGYLNSIYFDHGVYGVEDASIFYFGKSAKELSLTEACAIASIPKGPSYYSPIKNPEQNKERRNLIINELLKDEKIDEETCLASINEGLTIVAIKPQDESFSAPYYQDLVLAELKKMGFTNESTYQGLKVYTALDSDLNQTIVKSMDKRLPNSDVEVAVYAMDPENGHVLAVIGGKDYLKSTLNRATDSVRQPGSSIKPFLYLTALENGFTTATTFMSEETTFYINKEPYAPKNFQSIYPNMDVSMTYAIATSDNIYAMKTHLFLGTDKLVSTLKRFGISGDIPNIPSLALGTFEISLKEMTTAYAALANLGVYNEPTYITKITTFDDQVLYEKKDYEKKVIADKSDVYLLNEAMNSIFDNKMTYNIRPTGARVATLLSHKYSGKSGSTDTDNLMFGYNQDIVIGVWSGYDDNREIIANSDASFGKYLWADAVEGYLKGKNTSWYETPSDIIAIDLNPMTGFYPSFNEYYKKLYFKRTNIPWYIELLYHEQ